MVQLIGISKARSNFSSLVTQVAQTKQPVVIVRESSPIAIIQPFEYAPNNKDYLQKLIDIKGEWLDEKDYREIREEVEKRVKKLHHEKSSA